MWILKKVKQAQSKHYLTLAYSLPSEHTPRVVIIQEIVEIHIFMSILLILEHYLKT